MQPAAPQYRRHKDIVLSEGTASRYATNLATGDVHELNATAALILQKVMEGTPVVEIVEALAAQYDDVPRDELERDVREALKEMARAGLLEEG